MFITKKMLSDKHAHPVTIAKFGNVEFTQSVAEKFSVEFDIKWLAKQILPAPLWENYKQAETLLWKEYRNALESQYAKYRYLRATMSQRAITPIQAKYDRAIALLFVRLTKGIK